MFNIALMGAGRIGQIHAANIAAHPYSPLWAVVDPNEENAACIASKYQARQQSMNEAMTDPNVYAVMIASATETHADLIALAAKHGKAIFCEKPVPLDLVRVRDCLIVVKEHNVSLFIGFNHRFDLQFRKVKNEAVQGSIGKPESLVIISRDPSPPLAEYVRVSGGIFRDMTIHDFDMARFIMGEEPVSVVCSGQQPKIRLNTSAPAAVTARCLNTSSSSATKMLTPLNGSTLLPSCAARPNLSAAAKMVNAPCTWPTRRWSH